ncbi:transglycosylase domain-containing protein [Dactylosporangium aurantiacum]|uniref:Transglycosylase domain-containing protein n=1 Tax=Dactylosporangium aurantiacum TaxID=35754 RepID=A0A9Q9MDX5_9ACTN|nr:transglycosylase domain-containing protein [Dactylosporangium aurantiacum]MDG6101583.1 transglycosylase domain-containing protein [Dactylosporangium aurantiacum]UWZ52584.1 transglycosylase domain-containing protein [Dactylosporangium aurantiacum]
MDLKKLLPGTCRALVGLVLVTIAADAALEGWIASVDLPDAPLRPQASVLYYRDGHTVLARVGVTSHRDVPLGAIPDGVRRAVVAAEDRDFHRHWGVSVRGVVRAVVADAGGDRQGASTITQQYVRNAYLTQQVSAGRKAREFALAVKLERSTSKDDILARYLNTIYYGRGAYGIAAAADAYFGVPVERLDAAQGAVLAAAVKDPSYFDPAVNPAEALDRWRWIVAAMGDTGLAYPAVLPPASRTGGAGGNGLVVDQVERELARHGVTSQQLHTGGLSVVTTLDATAQGAALDLVGTALRDQPDGLRAALVAVDPAGGAVRAYYGGGQGRGYYDDAAAPHPPAATFKPVALAAGLREGIAFLSRWDGRSPRLFADRGGAPLVNRDGVQCPDCTLQEAMVRSLNTPIYALTQRIGAGKVRAAALDLGVSPQYGGRPSLVDADGDPRPGRTRADIAIGRYPVSPADVATVYATFAAGGTRSERHFVVSAATAAGDVLWAAAPVRAAAVDPRVAADVTAVLRAVVDGRGLAPGRPAAGVTGSQQWGNTDDNQDAWMAGYTPQLAAAVWMGRLVPGPIRDAAGHPVEGETLPARLWRDFLHAALRDTAVAAFPAAAHVGRTDTGDAGQGDSPDDLAGGRAPAAAVGARPVLRAAGPGRTVALTFDDGPSQYTTAVLDLLRQYRIRATFCVVGEAVAADPARLRRIVADGHALCNHSTHHDALGHATAERVLGDITTTDAAIAAAAPGAAVTYFRAPYGDWGVSAKVAYDLGHTPIGWSVDPDDWTLPGAAEIVSRVERQLTPGAIVLVHDGGGDRRQTVEALATLIPRLLAAGWTFDVPAVTAPPVAVPSPTLEPESAQLPTAPPPSPTPAGSPVESLVPTPEPAPTSGSGVGGDG